LAKVFDKDLRRKAVKRIRRMSTNNHVENRVNYPCRFLKAN
jgi:hypothetical protein